MMVKNRSVNFFKFILPVGLWGLVIIVISSIPHIPNLGKEDLSLDKLAHLIEYGVFSFLLVRAFYFMKTPSVLKKAIILTVVLSIIFAAADEIHQIFIPGRFASLNDFWADLGGIFLSQFIFLKRIDRKFKIDEAD